MWIGCFLKVPLRMVLLTALAAATLHAQWGGELRLSIRSDPKTFHPALADSDAAETIRYLTGGVLLRVNRLTQQLEPELATSWQAGKDGRSIVFQLRQGVCFSDGAPFSADDVVYTMQTLLDPNLHSATGDTFPGGSAIRTVARGRYEVAVEFPETAAGAARLFDQVAILSRTSPLKERAALGPFRIAEHKPGAYVLLARNPNYWKTGPGGRRLPYLDGVRLDIEQNRELELLRFRRGQVHLISTLDPDQFEQLAGENRAWVKDAGPTLEGEMLWFNMNAAAPLEAWRKAWFRSRNFRLAVSHVIRRDDLCRVVYHGHAQPGVGPFSAANLFWFNGSLAPHAFDLAAARKLLADDGFRMAGGSLRDREGHAVEFSLATNSGNPARERIAAMIQQDLAALGIRLNIVTLDFPSLIERIGKSFQYEACLLGSINVDLDPNAQMNIWLSSAAMHQWNPNQKQPETPWEAEIDRLMRQQASTPNEARRKALFDRVQQVVWEQAPMLYLVNKNALLAAAPCLRNLEPSVLRPHALWNVERLWIDRTK